MISHEILGTPLVKQNLTNGVRYHWVLSFQFERTKHLKTNCFKYSYIDPKKTDTCY